MTSALDEAKKALDELNAGVNTPSCEVKVDWRKLRGKEFWDFLKQHPEIH